MVEHFDAVVIGAGSVGVPAALALAAAGVKTLVLDSHPSVGQGSNKAAIGGLRATHSDPAKIRLNLRSLEIVSTFVRAAAKAWEAVLGSERPSRWAPSLMTPRNCSRSGASRSNLLSA